MKKKYFIPAYISEEECSDGLLIKNSYNSAKILLNNVEKEEYLELKINGAAEIKTELEKCLLEEEILVTAQMQKHFAEIVESVLNNTLYITLMPTESCNFRCVYCYETHEILKMSTETVSAIKEYISKLCKENQFKRVAVLWFGGEPTLCAEIIEDIGEHIKAIVDKKKIEFVSSMTTNAYLLTKEMFEKFLSLGITFFQITLEQEWDPAHWCGLPLRVITEKHCKQSANTTVRCLRSRTQP